MRAFKPLKDHFRVAAIKHRDCLKILRNVICKYKDLTCEFYQKYSLEQNRISKASLCDWSGTKK